MLNRANVDTAIDLWLSGWLSWRGMVAALTLWFF